MNKPVADRVKSIKQSDIRRISAIWAAIAKKKDFFLVPHPAGTDNLTPQAQGVGR